MLNLLTFHALDLVTNPILICETDATLIYKNEEAEKRLQVPHIKKKINVHLDGDGRERLKNYHDALPAFIDYLSEGESITAFVDVVEYENREVFLFVFSHLFDFTCMPRGKFMAPHQFENKLSGNTILSLATASYTGDNKPLALRSRQSHITAIRVFKKLISTVLTELYYGGETLIYSLDYATEIMNHASFKLLSRFGINVLFPLPDCEKCDIPIEFKPFFFLCSHLLILIAEVASRPSVPVTVTETESTLLFTITASIKDQDRHVFSGGAEAFANIIPGSAIDLYLFDAFCQSQNFNFQFSLSSESYNNLTLELRIPIAKKHRVCERIDRDKAIILSLIDLYAEQLDQE